jgi:hypothetical protein
MNITIEPVVLSMDIPRLQGRIGTTAAWIEFENQLEAALRTIREHPDQRAKCEFAPLTGYRKYKFHSRKKPGPKDKPDLRLIYEVRGNTVIVQALGERKKRQPDDIYRLAEARLPAIEQSK